MKRRETMVFLAAFAIVLIGGAALAQVATDTGSTTSLPIASTASVGESPPTGPVAETAPPRADEPLPGPISAVGTAADELASSESDSTPTGPTEEPPTTEPESPADETAPTLAILFPTDGQHFNEKTIAFEGTTKPGARVLAGDYEATVDDAGNWRIVLILSPGGNHVTFRAEDQAGNVAEASITVFYDVPGSDEPAPEHEFTAHQKWEVVDGSPAANVYFGTATPGSGVDVGSSYGHGSAVANEDGRWELKVTFPDAPCNESFTVAAEGQQGGRSEFIMKYLCAIDPEFAAHQKLGESTEPWDVFYGTAGPGATIWVVSDYGSAQATASETGKWEVKLRFNDDLPDNREVGVVVESSDGGRAEFEFRWIVDESDEIAFSAHQKYGSCAEFVPYDIFWGTAAPGSTISIVSPYGAGTTEAREKGDWDIEVEFPTAPPGESFTIVVESSDGGRATFTFVRTTETG